MAKFKKLISSVTLLVFCMVTLASCGGNKETQGPVYKINNVDITPGVYSLYLQEAYMNAQKEIAKEERQAVFDAIEEGKSSKDIEKIKKDNEKKDMFKKKIGDEKVSDWIEDETLKLLKRYVAQKQLSDDLEVVPSKEEYDNAYQQAEGEISQYKDFYSRFGIGIESVSARNYSLARKQALFNHFYDAEEGTDPVTDDDIKKYFEANYAKVSVYDFPTEEIKEENLDEYIAVFTSATEKLNAGDDYSETIEAMEVEIKALDEKYKEPEEEEEEAKKGDSSEEEKETEESTGETEDMPEISDVEDEMDEAEKAPEEEEPVQTEEDYAVTFELDSATYSYPIDVINAALIQENYTTYTFIQSKETKNLYIVSRLDLSENPTDLAMKRNEVMDKICEDDFYDKLEEIYKDYEVETFTSQRKKYSARKLHRKLTGK